MLNASGALYRKIGKKKELEIQALFYMNFNALYRPHSTRTILLGMTVPLRPYKDGSNLRTERK